VVQVGLVHEGFNPGEQVGFLLSVVDGVKDRKVLVISQRVLKN